VLILICIFLFTYTIIQLVKNKDLITSDPINYGMKVHNFTYCRCIDDSGYSWESEGKILKRV